MDVKEGRELLVAQSSDGEGGGMVCVCVCGGGKLADFHEFKEATLQVNIHKCLLTGHIFIGLSCRFSHIFEFGVVEHPVCFHPRLNHSPLCNHSSEDDKILGALTAMTPYGRPCSVGK